MKLEGGANRLSMHHHGRPIPNGSLRGSPIINANAPAGSKSIQLGSVNGHASRRRHHRRARAEPHGRRRRHAVGRRHDGERARRAARGRDGRHDGHVEQARDQLDSAQSDRGTISIPAGAGATLDSPSSSWRQLLDGRPWSERRSAQRDAERAPDRRCRSSSCTSTAGRCAYARAPWDIVVGANTYTHAALAVKSLARELWQHRGVTRSG
jgi:hypothetical protein